MPARMDACAARRLAGVTGAPGGIGFELAMAEPGSGEWPAAGGIGAGAS